jgi:CRP-like cAMP-binding protein
LQRLVNTGRIYDVAQGTRIVRAGEHGNTAYLVMRGRVVVGLAQDGLLASSVMLNAGDIFGEVAALTGAPRTADVVAAQPSEVLEVPAATLRELMREEEFGRIVLARMTARLAANQGADLPRGVGVAGAPLAEVQPATDLREQETVGEPQTLLSNEGPFATQE